MKRFQRFAALATLAAFLGLSALEAFHTHSDMQTSSTCSVCQIAQQTPTHFSPHVVAVAQWVQSGMVLQVAQATYEHILFVAHGLSPPIA